MSDDRAVALLQMRKLFAEISRKAQKHNDTSDTEDVQRWAQLLPLFAKVSFAFDLLFYTLSQVIVSYSPDEISFKELAPFTGHIARHLVQEIRKRAANQSTG